MFNDGIAINEIHSKIETIKGEEKKCVQALMSKIGIDISRGDPSLTSTRVYGFKLDGKTYEANHHRDILLEVAEIVLRKHPDEHDKILSIRGCKRKYFSKDLYDYRRIKGTNIYAELNENAKTLKKDANKSY